MVLEEEGRKMMTETQKNAIVAVFLGIGVISFLAAVTESPSIASRETRDVPEANMLSQEMPPDSSYSYGTREYVVINDMVSKGMVLRQYKRTFMNLTRQNADVEAAYREFDRDMEQYTRYLKEDILKLQSYRPARDGSKQSQMDTLERAKNLYTIVSQYRQHEAGPKDTLEFLGNCLFELGRLNQQSKLPND